MSPSLLALALAAAGCTGVDPVDPDPTPNTDSGVVDTPTVTDTDPGDSTPPSDTATDTAPPQDTAPDTRPQQADPPNLLLVLLDDVGADKVSGYAGDFAAAGYAPTHLPATPIIDSIGSSGVRFTHAWANPVCSPTRAALHSGEYGFRTGVGAPIPPAPELDADRPTLAEQLGTVYKTGAFGKWHLGTSGAPSDPARTVDFANEAVAHTADAPGSWEHTLNPLLHGFHRFAGGLESGVCISVGMGSCQGSYTEWIQLYADVGDAKKSKHGLQQETFGWLEETLATEEVVNQTLSWVGEVAHEGPWFASVNFQAAHTPHEDHTVHGCTTSDYSGADLSGDLAQYQSMTECMDTWLGELLDGLDNVGELDGTVIVVAGDNGTPTFAAEHPFDTSGRGKASTYESGLRVPFVVADGGAWREQERGVPAHAASRVTDPGRTDGRPIHTTDLFATFLQLAGIESTEGQDSSSFADALADPDSAPVDRALYAETFEVDDGEIYGWAALRDVAGMKLLIRILPNADLPGDTCIGKQLYDVVGDPLETLDLYGDAAWATAQLDLETELAQLIAEGATWLDVSTPCP